MHDLNDLYHFVQVIDHGGFAPAGRALGEPKSKPSRRIAVLKERLGVRPIQRSTRHVLVTEIGQNYYAHCKAMLVEADAAQAGVEQTRSEPSGIVRLQLSEQLVRGWLPNPGWLVGPANLPRFPMGARAVELRRPVVAGLRSAGGRFRNRCSPIRSVRCWL